MRYGPCPVSDISDSGMGALCYAPPLLIELHSCLIVKQTEVKQKELPTPPKPVDRIYHLHSDELKKIYFLRNIKFSSSIGGLF